jgi:hypothetical protein
MDQFSPAELAELFFVRESAIDAQFQFWISITFAVIVANFVGSKRLSARSRVVIALLYTLAVVVLVSRWYYVAIDAIQFREQLEALGVVINFPVLTVYSRIVLVALGMSASIVFLLSNCLHDDPGR